MTSQERQLWPGSEGREGQGRRIMKDLGQKLIFPGEGLLRNKKNFFKFE